MSSLLDWATLHVAPDNTDSAPSSALSYSSAGHDGLTDAEWLESPVVVTTLPTCPPATPAPERAQKSPRVESVECALSAECVVSVGHIGNKIN